MSVVVSGLYYYPIKSCAGIAVESANLGKRGIEYDRHWMVVDERNQFLTQRALPRMCLIQAQVQNGGNSASALRLEAPDMPPLTVPLATESERREVTVWRDSCLADDQGDEAAAWLSQFLKREVRLVYFGSAAHRQVDQQYALRESDEVGFADGFPLLLISQASLDDLNSRLDQPVPMNRFRPNLVVAGCGAFEEDTWKTIRVGDVTFDVVKPCARCTITTVDQTTGRAGVEPMRTLAEYRNTMNKVMFGQNIVHHRTGRLALGQKVEIVD
jgi:hypothetical protein